MPNWTPFTLVTETLEQLSGPVLPVGAVLAVRGASQERGTAFFVHPRFALTAAHVVTFGGDDRTAVATSIRLDLGGVRCSPGRVAVPSPWLESTDPTFDFALLRFDEVVCPPELTYVIETISEAIARTATGATEVAKAMAEGAGAAVATAMARIVGFHSSIREEIDVAVEQASTQLTYPVRNLPGHSGAPISLGTNSAGRPVAIGLHTSHSDSDGRGRGLLPTQPQLLEAIALLDTFLPLQEEQ